MNKILIRTLVEAVQGELISLNKENTEERCVDYVSKDSKDVKGDTLFFPIKGERFDGHDFIDDFFNNGGLISITENPVILEDNNKHYILVKNAKKSLLLLAEYYRNQFNIPLIGVTGSSGKTTTKDIIKAVLSEKYNVLATQGNYNNDIGVPFTIFNLEDEHEVAVIEMGMNRLGEIHVLSAMANPNIGVITNIGVAHIEHLKTRENILTAKCELFDFMKDTDVAILNRDDEMLGRANGRINQRKVWYTIDGNSEIMTQNVSHNSDFTTDCTITTPIGFIDVHLSVGGKHMVYNAMSAVAIGLELGMDLDSIKAGLEKFQLSENRMEISKLTNGVTLINDAYNANPVSMKVAIDSLKPAEGRKIGVFGYMGELGDFSAEMHRELGRNIGDSDIEVCFFIGDNGDEVEVGASEYGLKDVHIFKDHESLSKAVIAEILPNDIVLIKGSRSMKLEKVVNSILENCV